MKKRILCFTVAISILFTLMPFYDTLANEDTYDVYTYTETSDGITITGLLEEVSEIVIPESIDGKPVTAIGAGAFSWCYELKSVNLPETIISIGDYAFEMCAMLKKANIPDGVTYIGNWAFSYCDDLGYINIPASTTYIGHSAFSYIGDLTYIDVNENNPSYTSVDGVLFNKDKTMLIQFPAGKNANIYVVPDGVYEIGSYAFSMCRNIKKLVFPETLNVIGNNFFSDASGLTDIYYDGTAEDWSKVEIGDYNSELVNSNYHFTADETANDGDFTYEISNGEITITGISGTLSSATIPESINGKPVTKIAAMAFYEHNDIKTVKIPSTVKQIGDYAFAWCSELKSVEIGEGVEKIGDSAFYNCQMLHSINIPSGVTKIGASCFAYCSLLNNIKIPDKVDVIEFSTFSDCYSLNQIELPEGLEALEEFSFSNCETLENIKIPKTVRTIGEGVFSGCVYLKEILISENVTRIGTEAFSKCFKLKTIEIPENVVSIGDCVFSSCYNLESISVDPNSKNFVSIDGVLFDKNNTTLYAYPCKKSDTIYNVPHGVTTIKAEAFSENSNLLAVTHPDGITVIEDSAFYNCFNLQAVSLPLTLKTIGTSAFQGCSSLKTVSIPEGVTIINEMVFYECSSLKSAALPSTVTTIDKFAFAHCTNLANINLGNNITEINGAAFCQCHSLTEIKIPAHVKYIAPHMFYGCYNLSKVELPDGLQDIGSDAFADCDLEEIVLPNSLISVGENAFAFWGSLKVSYLGDEEDWSQVYIHPSNSALKGHITYLPYSKTKTQISEDGKNFIVTPVNISEGKTIILALYDGKKCVEVLSDLYNGEPLSFTTTKSYSNAMVMVWDNSDAKNIKPVCKVETVPKLIYVF